MSGSVWIAAGFALFAWWFSTGLILLVVRRADRGGRDAHTTAVIFGVPVMALGLGGAVNSFSDPTISGAYLGFLSALAIWGWIELAFLTGASVGPSKELCPSGAVGRERLSHAWNAIAYHELLLAIGLLAIAVAADGAVNKIALWTYLILFIARISAKLNIFFGVPRINVEFLPRPLKHLTSFFNQGPITPAFPAAITFLSFATACLMFQAATATIPAQAVGFSLLATLAALALLEHWLMVLPLPDAKLWRWMLPAPNSNRLIRPENDSQGR